MRDCGEPGTPATRRSFLGSVFRGGLLGAGLALGAEATGVLLGRNEHAVIPGRVYRCAQPSASELERSIKRYGIRTLLNLRGCNPLEAWYLDEARTAHRLDVAQEDVCTSAGRLPSVHEVRRLVEVFDRAAYPVLLHCKRGSDRTGLASAVALLSQTNTPLDEAARQLGWRYGHVPLGRPAYLQGFLRQYRAWLDAQTREHSREAFRHWLAAAYLPAGYQCRIEPLDLPAWLPVRKPAYLRFRACNTGSDSWRLRPEKTAGVHLAFVLWDRAGNKVGTGRAGMRDAEIQPGASVDLTIALPRVAAAGTYRLLVDMADEQHLWFFQGGSEPWEREIEARDEVAQADG